MDAITLIVLFVFQIILVGIVFFSLKKLSEKKKPEDGSFVLLQNQMNEISRTLDSKLGDSYRAGQHQFQESAKIIREVTEKLTRLDETNKQVINFADQLKHLQDILKNPKQRGILGEYYLKTVLENVLPPGVFSMQYEFRDGTIVDAAIFVRDKIIPVDSKFSLENYNRLLEAGTAEEKERYEKAFVEDLKNRIEETAKYIKPEEGTMEFSFMFIPSEAVFYDLLINKVGAMTSNTRDLIQYAAGEKKVIIVSPTTFLAYLQTVLQGLKAMQIEESTKEIIKKVRDLQKHILSYETYLDKMGGHLSTTVNAYNLAYKEFGKIDKDIAKISGTSPEVETLQIERPEREE